jgi:uncharacterized Tic20 family protein
MENVDPENREHADFEPAGAEPRGPSRNERQWAMGCHLIGLSGIIIPLPFAGIIATLVLWLLKREDGVFIDIHGKEALNFQISLIMYAAVCFFLTMIAIGFLLLILLALFAFISIVVAGVKASEGSEFSYPMCIRFIK